MYNFLDVLKKHEKKLRPYTMALTLAETVKEKTAKVKTNPEDLSIFYGTLCLTTVEGTDYIYLFPTEINEREIKGSYKKFYSDSNPHSEILHLLEKTGMSFQETERSREVLNCGGEKGGDIKGNFILRVE